VLSLAPLSIESQLGRPLINMLFPCFTWDMQKRFGLERVPPHFYGQARLGYGYRRMAVSGAMICLRNIQAFVKRQLLVDCRPPRRSAMGRKLTPCVLSVLRTLAASTAGRQDDFNRTPRPRKGYLQAVEAQIAVPLTQSGYVVSPGPRRPCFPQLALVGSTGGTIMNGT
jgi:hypothetical protein